MTPLVFDSVLPDPMAYREMALAQRYHDVTAPVGVFRGVAGCPDPTVAEFITARFPTLTPGLSFFRKSPQRQVEPTWIHSDEREADVTAILYLNPHPPAGDGTTFWKPLRAGEAAFEVLSHVEAKFGRLVLFPARVPHSRGLFDNYGSGDESRLIQVLFLAGDLEDGVWR